MEAPGNTSARSFPLGEVTGGPAASRSASGFREVASFDAAGRLVFDVRPPGEPHATLVVASSLFAEFQRNYRREVLLSRGAAAAGFRTVRFHYRGTGNSVGTDTPPDLDSMTRDLRDIVQGVEGPVALIGTRVGALAAARARDDGDVPLILWEPVIDGGRWIEEVIRAALARELGKGTSVNADTIRARWEADGVAFVLGETVPESIVRQIGVVSLPEIITGTGPVQIVQTSRTEKTKPDIERLVERLSASGLHAEVLPIVGKQTWWVNEGGDLFRPMERDEATSRLIDGIVDFVRRALP